jgi:hypothetical protein
MFKPVVGENFLVLVFGHLFRSNLVNYFSETLVKARLAVGVLVIYFFAPQNNVLDQIITIFD